MRRSAVRTASARSPLYASSHREIPTDPQERQRLQDLFLVELDTSLQGTKLLTSNALKVPERIEEFIQWRLVNRADQYPWQDRSLP